MVMQHRKKNKQSQHLKNGKLNLSHYKGKRSSWAEGSECQRLTQSANWLCLPGTCSAQISKSNIAAVNQSCRRQHCMKGSFDVLDDMTVTAAELSHAAL